MDLVGENPESYYVVLRSSKQLGMFVVVAVVVVVVRNDSGRVPT